MDSYYNRILFDQNNDRNNNQMDINLQQNDTKLQAKNAINDFCNNFNIIKPYPIPPPISFNFKSSAITKNLQNSFSISENPINSNTKNSETYQRVNEAHQRGSEYQRASENHQKLPETYQRLPETYHRLPETCQRVSETHQRLPETYQRLPETYPKLPETYSKLPENYSKLPEAYQKLPEAYQRLPEIYQKLPETHQRLPEANQRVPEINLITGAPMVYRKIIPNIKKQLTNDEKIALLKEKLASKKNSHINNNESSKNPTEKIFIDPEIAKDLAEKKAKEEKAKLLKHKKKLKEEEEKRHKFLAESNTDITFGSDILQTTTELIEKRKNPLTLIKFLISFNYSDIINNYLSVEKIPVYFESYAKYKSIFEPLILNEYVSSVKNNIDSIIKHQKSIKYISCLMKINLMNDEEQNNNTNDTLYVDLKPININNTSSSIGSNIQTTTSLSTLLTGPTSSSTSSTTFFNTQQYNNNNKNIFDVIFSNNYLIVLSGSNKLNPSKINNTTNKIRVEDFHIVGFLSNNDYNNNTNNSNGPNNYEHKKAQIFIDPKKIPIKMRNEWVNCYVYPIEKISTYIREYASLACLEYSDVLRYILTPKSVSNILNYQNQDFFSKFFNAIEKFYNPSQWNAIMKICLASDGISLLQGPPGTGKTHTLIGIVSGLYHYIKHRKTTCKKHIMICAPSNTAIDEIIIRLIKDGIYNQEGMIIRPNIVRIGLLDKNPCEIVKSHSLESLAEKELQKIQTFDPLKNEQTIRELKVELYHVTRSIENLKKGNSIEDKNQLQLLYDKRSELYDKYHSCKLIKSGDKDKFKELLDDIIMRADIICCTLSSAGSEKLDKFKDYIEAVIVDEASQCIEPTNIIPLQYSPKRLILIGDPKQLPATTFSIDSKNTLFNRSLLERILDCGVQPYFLNEQYRMTANIRKFPSMKFYEDRLIDSKNVRTRKFPDYIKPLTDRNMYFFDMDFSKEIMEEHSYYNKEEAIFCTLLMDSFIKKAQECSKTQIIGCISPYKKQVNYINQLMREKCTKFQDYIEVNTVDAFQGKEKDIIIFSSVRSSNIEDVFKDNYIGFLNDIRRLNVALTRPRYILYVIGNSKTLSTNQVWNDYIQYMKKNTNYMKINQGDVAMQTLVERLFIDDGMNNGNSNHDYIDESMNSIDNNENNKNQQRNLLNLIENIQKEDDLKFHTSSLLTVNNILCGDDINKPKDNILKQKLGRLVEKSPNIDDIVFSNKKDYNSSLKKHEQKPQQQQDHQKPKEKLQQSSPIDYKVKKKIKTERITNNILMFNDDDNDGNTHSNGLKSLLRNTNTNNINTNNNINGMALNNEMFANGGVGGGGLASLISKKGK